MLLLCNCVLKLTFHLLEYYSIQIPHYIIHFPIKPHLKSYFIIDSDTLLNKKRLFFFLSTTVTLTAYSSQNYSINMNKPYYISLFLSFPGSAVHLHTAYCVLYFKLTQRHKVIKPFL